MPIISAVSGTTTNRTTRPNHSRSSGWVAAITKKDGVEGKVKEKQCPFVSRITLPEMKIGKADHCDRDHHGNVECDRLGRDGDTVG